MYGTALAHLLPVVGSVRSGYRISSPAEEVSCCSCQSPIDCSRDALFERTLHVPHCSALLLLVQPASMLCSLLSARHPLAVAPACKPKGVKRRLKVCEPQEIRPKIMNGTPPQSTPSQALCKPEIFSPHEAERDITTNSKIYEVSPPTMLSVELKQCSCAAGITGAGGSGARWYGCGTSLEQHRHGSRRISIGKKNVTSSKRAS